MGTDKAGTVVGMASDLETSGLEARGVRLVVWRLSGSLSSARDPVGQQPLGSDLLSHRKTRLY